VSNKVKLDSECLSFDEFPERHFELAAEVLQQYFLEWHTQVASNVPMRKNRTVLNLVTEEATKLDHHPLSDDLEKRCVFSKIAGFQFCEEFLLLQLKWNLLGDGLD
jgi:hypothetical protein